MTGNSGSLSSVTRRRSTLSPVCNMWKNGLARQRATAALARLRRVPSEIAFRRAGAAVFLHDGLRRIVPPTDQPPFVYRVKRIDEHLRAADRQAGGDGAFAKAAHQRIFGFAAQARLGEPRGQRVDVVLVHTRIVPDKRPRTQMTGWPQICFVFRAAAVLAIRTQDWRTSLIARADEMLTS